MPDNQRVAAGWYFVAAIVGALAMAGLAALLTSIFSRQQEARNPFYRVVALNDTIEPLPAAPYPATGGSTDVGDVSWHVPTAGLTAVCFPAGSPGHSWQNVAAVGSPIGHKGLLAAAKVLAMTALDLLQDEKSLKEAKADLQTRLKGRQYTTRIPKGQKAPKSIR